MGIFDGIKSVFTKASPPYSSLWQSVGGGRNYALNDKKISELLRDYRGIVHGCVSAIAEDVAGIELTLHRRISATESEIVDEHPVLDLLSHANDFFTQFALFEVTTQHLELGGNSFWFVNRGKRLGFPDEVWPLYPDRVKVVADPGSFVSGYVYTPRGSSKEIPLSVDEVIHFKYYDPNDFYYGLGPLQAATRDYQIYTSAQEMNYKMFKNSAMPSGIISTDTPVDQKTYDRLKKQFADEYQGDSNAFKTMFLTHGFKHQSTTISPKDLLLIDQMRMTQEDIRQIFKVPKSRLLSVDDVKFSNFEGTERAYMRWNIAGKMKRITDQLNESLLRMYAGLGDTENLEFRFSSPVPSDKKLAAEIAALQVDKVRTRNEVREELGLDPVQGGDLLYVGFSEVALGSEATENNFRSIKSQNEMLQKQNQLLLKQRNEARG